LPDAKLRSWVYSSKGGYGPIRTPPAVSCKSAGLLDIEIHWRLALS
jgi:hypothetical protein